ncbi:unnamed protein product [Prunus brigantina]
MQSESLHRWYQSLLPVTTASTEHQQQRLLYSHRHVVTGFAARLTAEEVKAMEEKEEVLSMGLHPEKGFWKESNFGKGVIIGVMDTGVLPDHPSFRDKGMSPSPDRWKGRCDFNQTANRTFVCNKKIIGARSFQVYDNLLQTFSARPVDEIGHGTHTASTAVGNFVRGANLYNNANGTASGVAPHAHFAIYQVCSLNECSSTDVLAGFDAAVEDGVDVISISMTSLNVGQLFEDSIALAAFSAMQRGIFVVSSTIDTNIIATARLGNGDEFDGESIFQPNSTKRLNSKLLPLVQPGINGQMLSQNCNNGSLKDINVKGKAVFCERGMEVSRLDQGKVVKAAGGAAMLLVNQEQEGFTTYTDPHVLPASHLSYAAGLNIKHYNTTSKPIATVKFKGTVIGNSSAPMAASFSSKGPSSICPGILKPDIIGPGVSILAASLFPIDKRKSNSKSNFNVMSCTSMSCPHLSGVALQLC